MANIYIVTHAISGPYVQSSCSFHHTEADAAKSFHNFKASAGIDPNLIELIRLDTETLDATTIMGWEGTMDDLEEFDEEA